MANISPTWIAVITVTKNRNVQKDRKVWSSQWTGRQEERQMRKLLIYNFYLQFWSREYIPNISLELLNYQRTEASVSYVQVGIVVNFLEPYCIIWRSKGCQLFKTNTVLVRENWWLLLTTMTNTCSPSKRTAEISKFFLYKI